MSKFLELLSAMLENKKFTELQVLIKQLFILSTY